VLRSKFLSRMCSMPAPSGAFSLAMLQAQS
jgi:hypothetical protein